jgi:hypothetical protein
VLTCWAFARRIYSKPTLNPPCTYRVNNSLPPVKTEENNEDEDKSETTATRGTWSGGNLLLRVLTSDLLYRVWVLRATVHSAAERGRRKMDNKDNCGEKEKGDMRKTAEKVKRREANETRNGSGTWFQYELREKQTKDCSDCDDYLRKEVQRRNMLRS